VAASPEIPALATANKPPTTIVVVLFGVLRFVLAMVGAVARIVIKVKIDDCSDAQAPS
jgi:hypothetical protein